MSIAVGCGCGAAYELRDEFAGRRVKCPKCGSALDVPAASPVAAIPVPGDDLAFARDKFLLRQKRIAINEKYYVWDEQQRNILFIERPARVGKNLLAILGGLVAAGLVFAAFAAVAMSLHSEDARVALFVIGGGVAFVALILAAVALSPLRHTTVYRDDSRREPLLDIKQVNRWQLPNAHYVVSDGRGSVLAHFTKNILWNAVRRRWYVYRPDRSLLAMAKEDSVILSLLRRVAPDVISVFMRTNFIILAGDSDHVIGEFNRKFTLFDRYILDMTADPQHLVDRRIALALGVMLDTGERR